ncbi:MAG: hypothetical protein ACYDA8_01135 [Deferrisomatales bacterium]
MGSAGARPERAAAGGLAAGAALLALHQIGTFDYWTHLALGRAMWEAGAVRIGEPFLAHALGTPLVSQGWPFQWLAFAAYSAAGHQAVGVLVAVLAGVTFGALWQIAPEETPDGPRAAAWALALLAAFAARGRFVPRTEVLAYLLAAAALALAYRWCRRPAWGPMAALGGVLLAWSQTHLSWVAGAALVLPALLLHPRTDFWVAQWRRGTAARAAVLILAALTALVAVGAGRQLGAVVGALRGGALAAITEMQPLWQFPSLAGPFAAVAAGALLLAWGGREGRWRRVALWAAAVCLALVAARNVALGLLGVVAPALEGAGSGGAVARIAPQGRKAWLVAVGAALALIAAAAADRDPPWGAGVRWDLFPREAAQFVREAGLPGPVLNTLDIGGYLDWAWGGDPPTFVDGRVFGQSPEFRDVDAVANGEDPWEVLERRGTRLVVARALFYNSGRLLPLVPWLLTRPEWALVRASDALVFARRPLPETVSELPPAEAWRYVLWEAGVKAAEGGSPPHLGYSRGIAQHHLGRREEARREFARAAAEHPGWGGYYGGYLGTYGVAEARR